MMAEKVGFKINRARFVKSTVGILGRADVDDLLPNPFQYSQEDLGESSPGGR
jgi:hypothetical protein